MRSGLEDYFENVLLCDCLKDMKDKLQPAVPIEIEEEEVRETIYQRIVDNNLRDMFIGKLVKAEDIDNIVNTITLLNALVLTIPYGMMTSADHNYWTWVETTLNNCKVHKYSYHYNKLYFTRAFNSVLYSTIPCLVMALLYYLLRPKETKKFRKWWKFARYVVIMMMIGTIAGVVSLIAISQWIFSWYAIPDDDYCTYSAVATASVGISIIGIILVVSAFLML
jgi:hypothetical protein